jgi:hypothetical protein
MGARGMASRFTRERVAAAAGVGLLTPDRYVEPAPWTRAYPRPFSRTSLSFFLQRRET